MHLTRTSYFSLALGVATALTSVFCAGCHSSQPVSLPAKIISHWYGPQGMALSAKGGSRWPNTPEGSEALYQSVWDLVNQEYVDPVLNHQADLAATPDLAPYLPDWSGWRDHYKGKLNTLDDAYVAIETMLASLNDDYTRFLPPREMGEQRMSIDSSLSGVGIQLGMKNKRLWVVAPIDETPAAQAGVMPNDMIIEINGKQTTGLSVEAAADQIRGRSGTPVLLTLLRGNQKITVKLIRQKIHLKSVFARLLPMNGPMPPPPLSSLTHTAPEQHIVGPTVGYIRLSSFISESAADEMKAALAKLLHPPKQYPQGLIIDLRGNYGGLLTNAVDIADMFLAQGRIVSIVHRNRSEETYQAGVDADDVKLPLVLLIDGGSASASEIFAGAMKDNHRAVLVGTTSFGKGLVQKINPLPDGSGVNLTISKYLTPNGTDIHKKGITPNVVLNWTEKDLRQRKDVQLFKALAVLRAQQAQ